jgi:hypothetical protein
MNKLFSAIAPVAIVIAASFSGNAAYAGDSQSNTQVIAVAQAQTPAHASASGAVAMQAQHGLTRRDVYNQLVQAEKDGTMARLNALYLGS